MPLSPCATGSLVCLSLMLACGAGRLQAQTQASGPEGPPVVGTSDGGTNEVLQSIFIPPKAGAPFRLLLETEWAKPMFGGGTFTLTNRRRIMRDSAGRIYQERMGFVPKGSKDVPAVSVIQIGDPVKHTLLNCFVGPKQCQLQSYGGSPASVYKPLTHASGPLPDGTGTIVHEELGADDIAGVAVQGQRETTTVAPGVAGNDQPMVSVREFWHSERLGINLRSFVTEPMFGRQSFVVKEISVQEPEAKFFEVPEGYTVVDRRETPQPSPQP